MRRRRLQLVGAVALALFSCALFAARCNLDPAIPFVAQDEAAPWIMFPIPPTGLMGLAERDALPVTTFTRRFEAPDSAGPARLELRAMRRFRVTLNDAALEPDTADAARHWRRFRHFDLSGRLRPGSNELRVEVTNPTGPALLSLRLEHGGPPLVSDIHWQVVQPEGPARPAIRVGTERVNPTSYALESPGEALATRADTVLLLFATALLIALALLSPALAAWRQRLQRALPLGVVLIWTGLLLGSMQHIPLHVGFDAHHHVDYVEFLRDEGQLPLASDGWTMFHPPVYYGATAGLVGLQEMLAPASRSLLAWKLVGALAGLGSALLCGALARRLFGAGSAEATFALVFAAALPMNLYISAYVTNESLHATLACGLVLATVVLLRSRNLRPRELAIWSGVAALALLTKYTAWIVAGIAVFFLAARWLRSAETPPKEIARRLALLAAGPVVFASWFYLRNLFYFGQPFPLNVDLPGQTMQWWSQPGFYLPEFFVGFGDVLAHPFLAGTYTAWDSFYSTLWGDGQIGGQIAARLRHPYWDWELMAVGYWLALPASLLLLLGIARALCLAFRAGDGGLRAAHSFLLVLAWTLVLSVLFMTLRQQDYGQMKAFYALALIAPFSVFFALGCGIAQGWLSARGRYLPALLWAWLGTFAGVAWLAIAG